MIDLIGSILFKYVTSDEIFTLSKKKGKHTGLNKFLKIKNKKHHKAISK